MNPPTINDQLNFSGLGNGMVMMMNSSQREKFFAQQASPGNSRGFKILTDNQTKQKVLNLIQNDRNLSSRHKVSVDSRHSTQRRQNSLSRQNSKNYPAESGGFLTTGPGPASTEFDAMQYVRNEFD